MDVRHSRIWYTIYTLFKKTLDLKNFEIWQSLYYLCDVVETSDELWADRLVLMAPVLARMVSLRMVALS